MSTIRLKKTSEAIDKLLPFPFRQMSRDRYDTPAYSPVPGMTADQILQVATIVAPMAYDPRYWYSVLDKYPLASTMSATQQLVQIAAARAELVISALDARSITPARYLVVAANPASPGDDWHVFPRHTALDHYKKAAETRISMGQGKQILMHIGESMYSGACVFCGHMSHLYLTPDNAEVGKEFLLWFDVSAAVNAEANVQEYFHNVHGWNMQSAFTKIVGVCRGCAGKHICKACARIVNLNFVADEIGVMASDNLCLQCMGGALYLVQPPKLDMKDMRRFAKAMKEKKGGMAA